MMEPQMDNEKNEPIYKGRKIVSGNSKMRN